MRLYVRNKSNEKVYLSEVAPTRLALSRRLGSTWFYLGRQQYSVNDVKAEPGSNSSVTGAVSGALVGALGGPIGILLGLGLGTLIGSGIQGEENFEVNKFNRSKLKILNRKNQ